LVQLVWLFLSNGYFSFLGRHKIYAGPLKGICAPGLNCYSCPAATLGCPIGGLQHFMASLRPNLRHGLYMAGFYILGTLMMIGAFVGRMACGWACPFGLLQEVLYKLPTPKYKLPQGLKYIKYGILLFFVFLFPALIVDRLGYGQNWFCRFLCPAGTLEAGIPLLFLIPDLRAQIGWLFFNKLFILIVFLLLMVFFKRPFCRILCPLGAFYSFFNRISLLKMYVNKDMCTKCNLCYQHCPMELKVYEDPNQLECIRCFICQEVCPQKAVTVGFGHSHTTVLGDKSHIAACAPDRSCDHAR